MTERELIIAAKIFQANCGANKDKVSFADSCKIVILSRLLERFMELNSFQGTFDTTGLWELLNTRKPWWKRYKERFGYKRKSR